MTTSSDNNPIVSVDALTSEFTPPRAIFSSQWSNVLQPTPYKDGLYMSARYYGSVVYGFDYTQRSGWGAETKGYIWDCETPAVDEDTVYFYSGKALELIDRRTGDITASLAGPFFKNSFYSYYGAPILGTRWAMSWPIRASAARARRRSSSLVAVDQGLCLAQRHHLCDRDRGRGRARLPLARRPGPARRARRGDGPRPVELVGNTMLTDTLVFVSTNKAIYATPLQGSSHTSVWNAR